MCSSRAMTSVIFILATGVCFAEENDDALFARYAKSYVLVDGKVAKVPQIAPGKDGRIYAESCKVGDAGHFDWICEAVQVVSKESVLIAAKYQSPFGNIANPQYVTKSTIVMVKNYSTTGLTDGKSVDLPKVAIIGTTKVDTKTVLLAVPVDKIGITRSQFDTLLKAPGVRSEFQVRLKADLEAEAILKREEEEEARVKKEAAELAKQGKVKEEAQRQEKLADANLKFAAKLIAKGEEDKGKKRLREISTEFPGTKAAAEAEKRLKEMGKNP